MERCLTPPWSIRRMRWRVLLAETPDYAYFLSVPDSSLGSVAGFGERGATGARGIGRTREGQPLTHIAVSRLHETKPLAAVPVGAGPGGPMPSIPRQPNQRSGSSPIATRSVVAGRFGAFGHVLFQPSGKCPGERGLT